MKNYILDIDRHKGRTALISENAKVSYDELTGLCAMLENVLLKDSVTFILCKNTAECIAAYIAVIESRSTPLLLNENISRKAFISLYRAYRPEYVFIDSERYDELDDFIQGRLFSFSGYSLCVTGFGGFERINTENRLLLATSGSTGDAKLVRLSEENIRSNAESIAKYLDINRDDIAITTLPMNYTYGLSVINSHLLKGAAIAVTDASLVELDFWEFFEKTKPSTLAGVPYTYDILDRLNFFEKDCPSLKYLTQAGGRLSVKMQEKVSSWAEKYKKKFFIMYGQTEATARMSYLPWEKCLEKKGSIGIAIPGGSFTLESDRGETVTEADREGELVYRGKNVSLGYALTRADLEKGDERKGVLHTGDLAKRDDDGFYYITGRKKRFIKLFGIRVGLDGVEEMLQNELKTDIAVTGSDDSLMIYHETDISDADIEDKTAKMLGINKKVIHSRRIEKIPRNDSGKKDYKKLEML